MFGLFSWFKRRRRREVCAEPFPEAWYEHVRRAVRIYDVLSTDEQRALIDHTKVFLAEKRFVGCAGLEIDDEIRVVIAAQASLLLLNQARVRYYPTLKTIFVYPARYTATQTDVVGGVVVVSESTRAGESWTRGQVVLSWDDVARGAADIHDGNNVTLHEFAHQLDAEDGYTDGAPVLDERSMHVAWARVLTREYKRLLKQIERNRKRFLDDYGATNPAEFFAVATEHFFERPEKMKRLHPELYAQLAGFYRQDPAARYLKARARRHDADR